MNELEPETKNKKKKKQQKPWFSWILVWQVTFYFIMFILSIMLEDSILFKYFIISGSKPTYFSLAYR